MLLSTHPLKQRLYDFGGTKSDMSLSNRYDRESAIIFLTYFIDTSISSNELFFVSESIFLIYTFPLQVGRGYGHVTSVTPIVPQVLDDCTYHISSHNCVIYQNNLFPFQMYFVIEEFFHTRFFSLLVRFQNETFCRHLGSL